MNQPSIVMRHGRLVRRIGKEGTFVPPVAGMAGSSSPPAYAEQHTSIFTRVLISCFILALWLPFNLTIASVRLTPVLTFLLIGFLPFLVIWLFKRPTPVTAPDYLIMAFWFWVTIAVLVNQGIGDSIQPIGVHLLQTVGAYAAGRVLVRNATAMRFMIAAASIALVITAPFALIEALTGVPILLRVAHMIGPAVAAVDMSPRMGLHRAQGTFEHPILLGIFAASIFSIAAYALGAAKKWFLRWTSIAASIGVATLTLSTGALLSLNVQFGLMLWQRIFRDNPKRWRNLGILLAIIYISIDTISTRTPFHVFVQYATFSSGSSYNRINIWEYGTAEALRHPFFGIGFGEWQRPRYMSSSMDNFWLVQAVRYGIPAFLLLFSAALTILLRMGRRSGPDAATEHLRRGTTFSLVATMIAIGSVHLWNSSYVWLIFLLGSSVWMTLPVTQSSTKPVSPLSVLTPGERAQRRTRPLAAE